MFTTPLVAISLYEMANNGNGFINVVVLVAVVMAAVNVDRLQPVIQHNSELTGAKYFAEIMDTENVHCLRSVARMDKETFMKLPPTSPQRCRWVRKFHLQMYRTNGDDLHPDVQRIYSSHHLCAMAA